MNSQSSEQNVLFLMAYLALRGSELPFDIPTDRDAYRLLDDHRYAPGIEGLSISIRIASDTVFNLRTTISSSSEPLELDNQAERIVGLLRQFERYVDDVVEEVENLREHAMAQFSRLPKRLGMRFLALELELEEHGRLEPSYKLRFERLNDGARKFIDTVEVSDTTDIDAVIGARRGDQASLTARAVEFEKEGADGAIDIVLLAHLKRLSIDPHTVIESAVAVEPDKRRMTSEGPLTLFWKDGILTGTIPIGTNARWHGGTVLLNEWPAEISGDIASRKVNEIVSHPYFEKDLTVISGIAAPGKRGSFQSELRYDLFNSDRKAIW